MTHKTDAELIGWTLSGDRSAGRRLMERHRDAVFATARQALGNWDDAWDVAQETLIYGLTHLPQLRDRERFAGWLTHIALSQCADYRRRRGTRRLGHPLELWNEAAEEQDYAGRLTVRQAVDTLSEAHRTTLLLHYEGGWSVAEVAGLLSVPVNTVRSRLMAAKRHLRADLQSLFEETRPMPTQSAALAADYLRMIESAFPGSRIVSVENDPEPWQPFSPQVTLTLDTGELTIVDFRTDITPDKAALLAALSELGIPVPAAIAGPIETSSGYLTMLRRPAGENLSLWALGGTPHRIRLATERAFEGIDRLQGVTGALLDHSVGQRLAHRTLADEAAALMSPELWNAHPWLNWHESEVSSWRTDGWFAAAASKVKETVADIRMPLAYTHYLHFFPNVYRIHAGADGFDPASAFGWPGDSRTALNPLAEVTEPFGHFGDPLLGLAMVWIYDCYPFVHTGFVEQFLMRRDVSRREFAPRLALMALQTIARQLPVARPEGEDGWWDSVRAYAEQGLSWI